MRRRPRCFPALLALLAGAAACARQPDATYQPVAVAPGIWLLARPGDNLPNAVLAVGEEGALLVDTDYGRYTPGLLEAVRGLTPRPLRFVLDTHWHADHAEGNAVLAAAGAVIVAQENTRARLSREQVTRGVHVPPLPPAGRPSRSFRDTLSLQLGRDLEARAVWLGPAHTDGDVVVRWPQANVIATGDLTCYYAYPYFDEDTGADVAGMVAAVNRIVELADDRTRIIGGHGPLATRADLVAYRDMLQTIVQRVSAQLSAGRSVQQVIASRPTAEFDARWARPGTMPADTLVALVYRNLRAHRSER